MTGIVFNIQRFSIHDGPGIRTTVFLKGCSLRCFWCHNPEGLSLRPEIQCFPDRCIGCGACLTACDHGAHASRDGAKVFLREKCVACGKCVETCYAGAMVLTGKRMTVEEVVGEVLQDLAFYKTSGGGMTLSGGEPSVQLEFSTAILTECKARELHTTVQTSGNCRWEHLGSLLGATDLVMMDLKHIDPVRHRAATGVSNQRILANARRLAASDKPVIFRVPVIPTVNDTPEDIAGIARFVRDLVEIRLHSGNGKLRCPGSLSLELLPFHRLAGDKYRSLGLEFKASGMETPSKDKMAQLREAAAIDGVVVRGN